MAGNASFDDFATHFHQAAQERKLTWVPVTQPGQDPTLEVLERWRAQHPWCEANQVWRKDGDPAAVITIDGRCDLCKQTDAMIEKLRP